MKKTLSIITVLVVIFAGVGVAVYLLYFKNPKAELTKNLESLVKDYYDKNFYPSNKESIYKYKDTGVQITLQMLMDYGYNIAEYEKKDCNLKETFGVIRYKSISSEEKYDYNYDTNYTISINLKCSF